MRNIKGKTALVTGATSGIGLELAKLFAQDGIDLVLVARRKELLVKLKSGFESQYGINVYIIDTDLSKPGKASDLYELCTIKEIHIDYLINNAGYGDYKRVAEANERIYDNMLQLNVSTLTELTTLFVKNMIKRGYGKILNLGSLAAFQSTPMMAV